MGASPPSPVGTASAQAGDGSGGPCGAEEWFLTLITGTIFTTNCQTAEDISDTWNETDATETRTQIHSQAGQLAAGNEQYLTAMSNSLVESDTIAFSKGEAAAVEVLANGGTVSEAQSAANESIEDYYAVKQRNLLDRWNVGMETVVTLNSRAANTTGVDSDFVTLGTENNFTGYRPNITEGSIELTTIAYSSQYENIQYDTITTVNGSGESIAQPRTHFIYGNSYGGTIDEYVYQDWRDAPEGHSGAGAQITPGYFGASFDSNDEIRTTLVRVRPTENLSSTNAVAIREFYNSYEEIETKSQSTKQRLQSTSTSPSGQRLSRAS